MEMPSRYGLGWFHMNKVIVLGKFIITRRREEVLRDPDYFLR
jgi:hypothetical protein